MHLLAQSVKPYKAMMMMMCKMQLPHRISFYYNQISEMNSDKLLWLAVLCTNLFTLLNHPVVLTESLQYVLLKYVLVQIK